MEDFEELKKQALKQAKWAINISVVSVSVLLLFMLQRAILPDLFVAKETEEFVVTNDGPVPNEPPFFGLDSTEVENGVHIPTGLIMDEGVLEVSRTCGACHSLDLVTQNRADREGWKEIIVWMQETQKLWDLGENEPIILDYLSKNYAPENTGRRKNLEGIEWYELEL